MVRGGVPPYVFFSNQTANRESDHVRRICHAPGEQGAKFISIKLSWLGAHDVCQRADLRTAPAQTRDLLTTIKRACAPQRPVAAQLLSLITLPRFCVASARCLTRPRA